MGTVYAEITLRNAEDVVCAKHGYLPDEAIRVVTVTAVVDTGAHSLMIDNETMRKLGLGAVGKQGVKIANGERLVCPITDAVEINWKDRQTVMRAVAIPGLPQILLGVLPLQDMDLMVNPSRHELVGAHGDKVEYMAL